MYKGMNKKRHEQNLFCGSYQPSQTHAGILCTTSSHEAQLSDERPFHPSPFSCHSRPFSRHLSSQKCKTAGLHCRFEYPFVPLISYPVLGKGAYAVKLFFQCYRKENAYSSLERPPQTARCQWKWRRPSRPGPITAQAMPMRSIDQENTPAMTLSQETFLAKGSLGSIRSNTCS